MGSDQGTAVADFSCHLMRNGRMMRGQAYGALVNIILTKFRPIGILSYTCPVSFVPLSNVQESYARRAV